MGKKNQISDRKEPNSNHDEEEESSEEEEETSFQGEEDASKMRTKKKMMLPLLDTPEVDGSEESSSSEEERTQKKRPADSAEINSRDSKRGTSSLGTALKPFERKWSESDEIRLLEEMLKNKSKNTVDSSASSLIGDSCPFGFKPNGNQLKEKISKLKRKYKKNTEKVDHSAMKPHDVQVFRLSRKVWGDLGKGSVGKILEAGPIIPFHTHGLDSARKELLKEASELVQEPHPWQSSQPWLELRIEECELVMKKIDLMKQQSKLEDKKFDLAKKQVGITIENLKASLREKKDED